VFFGAALGNVVRGVPLDATGRFFLPMWVDFRLGPPSGILDWYTVLVGIAALAALALHGALWIALKLEGEVEARAQRLAGWLWWAVLALTSIVTLSSFNIQAQLTTSLSRHPWIGIFPVLAVAGLLAVPVYLKRRAGRAFLASCVYLVGMMASVAFGLYPFVLPARPTPGLGLTAQAVAAPAYGLKVGLAWWIPGMVLVTIYFVFMYRRLAGKIAVEQTGH
jgi:cytochrome d ubiquinol oxidase subunit II